MVMVSSFDLEHSKSDLSSFSFGLSNSFKSSLPPPLDDSGVSLPVLEFLEFGLTELGAGDTGGGDNSLSSMSPLSLYTGGLVTLLTGEASGDRDTVLTPGAGDIGV